AIERSPAMKAYFVNLMWQPGETINFSASRHVEAIHAHSRPGLIDCIVVNVAPIRPELRRKYARAHVRPVENDFENLKRLGVKVVTAELFRDTGTAQKKIRHDPAVLASVVIDLASRSRAYQVRKELITAQARRFK